MAERPASHPPFRQLAEPIAALAGRLVARRGFPHALVLAHWPDIVGAEAAPLTLPERISYPPRQRRRGTLIVRVASPSLAVELAHAEPRLIAAFNLYAGGEVIAKVRLRHGPLPAAAVRALPRPSPVPAAGRGAAPLPDLAAIEDLQLRQALARLGEALAAGEGGALESP